MSRRYVLFAAVYGSDALALDGLRVLTSAAPAEVAGTGLMHRDQAGRTTLQRTAGSTVLRAALVGLAVGFAAGLGTRLMWASALIGAAIGCVVGYRDRTTEDRELDSLVGELVQQAAAPSWPSRTTIWRGDSRSSSTSPRRSG